MRFICTIRTFKILPLIVGTVKDGAYSPMKNKYMCSTTIPKAITGNAIVENTDEIDLEICNVSSSTF